MVKRINPIQYSRSLTRRYLIAISLIAITILSSYAYIQYQLKSNEDQSEIINISGRQRMLSQRIAFFATNIAVKPYEEKTEEYIENIGKAASLMLNTHERLIEIANNKQNEEILALYFSDPHNLDKKVRNFVENVNTFLDVYKSLQEQSSLGRVEILRVHPSFIYIVENAPTKLLASLNEAVSLYQLQSEEAIDRFAFLEMLLVISALTLLVLEVLFIFKPMVREVVNAFEDSQKALQKAEDLNRLKTDFLNNMSHEIRTPLHGIMGSAELLREAAQKQDQEKYIESITDSSERLLEHVGHILEYSKFQTDEITVNPNPVKLIDFLNNLSGTYKEKAEAKKLIFRTEYSETLPTSIVTDEILLQQMLSNILDNAVKFTKKGSVKFAVEDIEREDYWATLRFEIIDTGIGISAEQIANIFEIFSQGDSSLKKEHNGIGLGLTITNAVANVMGTTIHVESELGKGAHFWVELTVPLSDLAAEDLNVEQLEDKAEEQEITELNIDVLLVENELVNQMVATDMLESIGCNVDLAENGQEALDMLKGNEEKYAIILMDCMMPLMDGFEATQEIRKQEESTEQPKQRIIALTANALKEDRERCLNAGMDDYLSKPVTKESLYAKIKEHLSKGEKA